jgi:hypothetical protein
MVKGFSLYNIKILEIILVATFSSLLTINHEDGMTSAMGIQGLRLTNEWLKEHC